MLKILFLLSQFPKAEYVSPLVWKANVHRFSKFKDLSLMLKRLFTLLYGSCEVLGGDSDTETTTEVNITVKTGKIKGSCFSKTNLGSLRNIAHNDLRTYIILCNGDCIQMYERGKTYAS